MNQFGPRTRIGKCDVTFAPQVLEMLAPCLLQALEEQVGAAKKEDLRHRSVAFGEGREILVDHRLEEAGNDFLDLHTALDQAVGITFSEDAAL